MTDEFSDRPFSMFDGTDQVKKMLSKCMDPVYSSGYRGHEFMEWLGWSLGIAWFEKPKIDEKTGRHSDDTFDISLNASLPERLFIYLL